MNAPQEATPAAEASQQVWADRRVAPDQRTGLVWKARQAARWAQMTAARPLHPARMLPGFLIVGAERCGTTSMFHLLRQHPAVFSGTLPRKEVHYFDHKYGHGPAWYRCHFPITARTRLATRRGGTAPVAFEATANYMFHPLAPGRIHHDLPGVRLLVLVRDPVERAYSAHAHQTGYGYENEPFERALELEDARLAGESERMAADPSYASFAHDHHTYRARGYYADQLGRLESLFGRDAIHVVDSDSFFADPGPAYGQVLDFLGLPGHTPRFTPQNARPRSPMPESLRASLREHFRPHDERLTPWLLGHQPSWRR